MRIQDLKQNHGIYILEIHQKLLKPILTTGAITFMGQERVMTQNGKPERVIDLDVADGFIPKRVTLPLLQNYGIFEGILYTPDIDIVLEALEKQKRQCENVINAVDANKSCLEECDKLMEQLSSKSPRVENINEVVNKKMEELLGGFDARIAEAVSNALKAFQVAPPTPPSTPATQNA